MTEWAKFLGPFPESGEIRTLQMEEVRAWLVSELATCSQVPGRLIEDDVADLLMRGLSDLSAEAAAVDSTCQLRRVWFVYARSPDLEGGRGMFVHAQDRLGWWWCLEVGVDGTGPLTCWFDSAWAARSAVPVDAPGPARAADANDAADEMEGPC